ncbi:acyl-CoA dehydrogenase family protein [Bradyrhizobium genosp. A]|uniref:acyl-CoA dehydrogenase family protein n=1 Tax=Bradyrhizobium genosp. A TaxID=83626 RepID=UPI003CF319E2
MDEARYREWFPKVKDLIWKDLPQYIDRIERQGHIPHSEVIPKLAALGLYGCLVPESYGGLGLTVKQYVPVLIELSKMYAGLRGYLHAHVSASKLLEFATDEQKARLYPGVASGKIQLGFALTEPDNGTGIDISTTATRLGDIYQVNGRKHLISNCDIADYLMLVCYTDRSKGPEGISVLLLPKDAPGFTWDPVGGLMGCKGAEHGRLNLDNAQIPAANLLGGVEGKGLHHALEALEESRVFIASTSLGTAERVMELSLQYAKERVTFGKPIATRETIRTYLAEMATDIYALRTMLTDAIGKLDRGERIPAEAAMCKQFGAEAVCRVTDRALLIHGGVGYTTQRDIERHYRDCRINIIEEGTPSIQRTVIARTFLDGYRFPDFGGQL